jgi:hypothetical protein
LLLKRNFWCRLPKEIDWRLEAVTSIKFGWSEAKAQIRLGKLSFVQIRMFAFSGHNIAELYELNISRKPLHNSFSTNAHRTLTQLWPVRIIQSFSRLELRSKSDFRPKCTINYLAHCCWGPPKSNNKTIVVRRNA